MSDDKPENAPTPPLKKGGIAAVLDALKPLRSRITPLHIRIMGGALLSMAILGGVGALIIGRDAETTGLPTVNVAITAFTPPATAVAPPQTPPADGRLPWVVNAQFFDTADMRPKVSLIINHTGLNTALDEQFIATLPKTTGFALSPYAAQAGDINEKIHNAGFEIWLQMPVSNTARDGGPLTISSTNTPNDNAQNMAGILATSKYAVGIVMGDGDIISQDGMLRDLIRDLATRGIAIIHAIPSYVSSLVPLIAGEEKIPHIVSTMVIDQPMTPAQLRETLNAAVQTAREKNAVLITISPYPALLDPLKAWLATLPADIVLAPPSAVLQKPQTENAADNADAVPEPSPAPMPEAPAAPIAPPAPHS